MVCSSTFRTMPVTHSTKRFWPGRVKLQAHASSSTCHSDHRRLACMTALLGVGFPTTHSPREGSPSRSDKRSVWWPMTNGCLFSWKPVSRKLEGEVNEPAKRGDQGFDSPADHSQVAAVVIAGELANPRVEFRHRMGGVGLGPGKIG